MVFFTKELKKDLTIHPRDLGPQLKSRLREKLCAEVEGKSFGRFGYVVKVEEISNQDGNRGKIDSETGMVNYKINFNAIVFRPFRLEVIDAVVGVCHELGFFCYAGPLEVFVSHRTMPDDLQNFTHGESKWVSDDGQVEIGAGVGVRVRIMNLRIDSSKIFAVGTIKDDFLGLIEEAI